MTFTKRSEKQSIGKPTSLEHKDVYADVELRVSAKQGPDDPIERVSWLQTVRSYYEKIGYAVPACITDILVEVSCQENSIRHWLVQRTPRNVPKRAYLN